MIWRLQTRRRTAAFVSDARQSTDMGGNAWGRACAHAQSCEPLQYCTYCRSLGQPVLATLLRGGAMFPRSRMGLVSRVSPVQTALRNCTRDEGRSFEVGNQVLISSHRKLLLSKAMVVNVAEKSGQDSDRQG
jgi:hypothetical protein